jgi:integrase
MATLPILNHPNPEVRRLATLASDLMSRRLAVNSCKNYGSQFDMFVKWCSNLGLPCSLPTPVCVAAAYITHRIESAKTFSTVKASVAGLGWAHSELQLADPTRDPSIRALYSVAERLLPANINRKDAISPEMIVSILRELAGGKLSLEDQVGASAAALAYFTFARHSDLAVLRCEDVTVGPSYVEIFFERAKNDQRRHGKLCHVPRAQGLLDLGSVLSKLRSALGDRSPEAPLFPHIVRGRKTSLPIKCQQFSDSIRQLLARKGFNVQDISSHSLRSGGMSMAIAMGVDFSKAMAHGRWRSADAASRYVCETVDARLHVGQAMLHGLSDPSKIPEVLRPTAAAVAAHKRRRAA